MTISKAVPLGDQVAAELQRAIVQGDEPAGSILTEESLAARFEVSRNPIRRALGILESQHLVEKVGRSYRVVGLQQEDLDEIYKLRLAIESLAWEQLQENGGDVPELGEALQKMADAVDRQDASQFAAADMDFHSVAVKLSKKRRVTALWDQIEPSMRLILQITNLIDADLGTVYHRHEQLVEVMKNGSRDDLSKALKEHVLNSRRLLN